MNQKNSQMVLKVIPERCAGCRVCQLICSLFHFKVNNPKKSRIGVQTLFPEPGVNKPIVCRQCKNPACMEVCPTGAITVEDGIVKLDEEKCDGCLACVDACPFGALFTHPDIPYPLKCDLCGGNPQCVIMCPKEAIKLVPREKIKDKNSNDERRNLN